jgi:ATP-dependent DNA helicase RecG
MTLNLDDPISSLPKVGNSTTKLLNKVGVFTLRDLLFYFPYRYLDFSKFKSIAEIKQGETVTIRVKIKTIHSRFSFRGRMSLCEAVVSDNTGSLKIVWFNQAYLATTLQPGDDVLLSGKVDKYKTLQLQNPIYEKFSEDSTHTGRLVPIYHATENLYNRTIRNLVKIVLPLANEVEDIIPAAVLKDSRLINIRSTITELHFPTDNNSLKRAQTRIIFDEIFIQQLAVQMHRQQLAQAKSVTIPQNISLIKEFLGLLPFKLTPGQKQALWDVVQDMEKPQPMNRLLEGDVGSGKTLVAVASALEAAAERSQVVILAPTEILARQHYESFQNYLRKYPFTIGLLTRNFRLANEQTLTKKQIQQSLADGTIPIIIGTHAILQEGVAFKNLGLVVIDEQHRFGVKQRGALLKLTAENEKKPHLLSMTATPIPRTLALSLYSDLDISVLKDMPLGRRKIATRLVKEHEREQAYKFITGQITAGRQAFVVTPRVEESETSTIKSAKEEVKRLQEKVFPKFRIGLIHGKLKGTEKEQIMAAFYNRELDILVATSVIEIGIDVPNATVMVIEDAERFGLAQLHQLRGRVGRGEHASFCLLFTSTESPESLDRLKTFSQTHDGFKLAELDLKQRGFGSLFGTDQTGFDFRYSQYLTMEVLKLGQIAAQKLLKIDNTLQKHPKLKKQVDPLLEQIHLE